MSSFLAITPLNAANFESGAASDGQVLTADGSGGTAWQDAAGNAPLTDVTYTELVALISSSGMTPRAFYRITDFRTKHYIAYYHEDYGTEQVTTGDGIITGELEPLVVQALAENSIDALAFSAAHPADVLHYDWDASHFATDYSYTDQATSTIVPGWTGAITFRHDTVMDNYTCYDWRAARIRRWETAVPAWNAQTQYGQSSQVTYSNAVWLSLLASNLNQQPAPNSAAWTKILDLTQTVYWNARPDEWNGRPSGEAYQDVPTFGANCTGNHVARSYSAQSLLSMAGNTFGANCFSNTFGESCFSNTFGVNCSSNTFGANCSSNTFGESCYSNTFGAYCFSNTFGVNCYSNTFGVYCSSNTFGVYCSSNTFGAYCFSNTFGANAQLNQLSAGFNGAILTTATHVYGSYFCELVRDAGGTNRLRYFDANGAQQIVLATA